VFINDTANNQNRTQNRTITLDNTYPTIDYSTETPNNGTNTSSNSLFINVTVVEANLGNITFTLHNTTAQVNQTLFTDSTRSITFENLPDGSFTYDPGIEAQRGHASVALQAILVCMAEQVPGNIGRISSISDNIIVAAGASDTSWQSICRSNPTAGRRSPRPSAPSFRETISSHI